MVKGLGLRSLGKRVRGGGGRCSKAGDKLLDLVPESHRDIVRCMRNNSNILLRLFC